jgi:membrane protease YdiL (CAAX protease family)
MHRTTSGHTNTAALVRFLAVTFGAGFALQLAAAAAGFKTGGGQALLLATMWAPALGVLAAGGELRAGAWAAVRRHPWRWVPAAFVLGLGPQLLQRVLLVLGGASTWDSKHVELAADGGSVAGVHGLGMVLGVGPQGFAFFALNLLVTLFVASVFAGAIGGLGEEIGWRGLLQPELERRLGAWRGTFLTGLIWAAWHLPANLAGYNDPAHPGIGTFLVFPLEVVAMGVGLAWLTRRTGSVWPAALAHGANNTIGAGLLVLPTSWAADTVAGLLGSAVVVAVVLLLARRDRAAAPGAAPDTEVAPALQAGH